MHDNSAFTPVMKEALALLIYAGTLYPSSGLKPYTGVTRFVEYDHIYLTMDQLKAKYGAAAETRIAHRPTLSRLILAGYAEYTNDTHTGVKLSNRPPVGFTITGKKLGRPDFYEVLALECQFCGRLFKETSYKKHRCQKKTGQEVTGNA